MSKETLDGAGLDELYRLLAEAVDRVGRENESLFLTKLAMILANQLGDIGRVRNAIEDAADNL